MVTAVLKKIGRCLNRPWFIDERIEAPATMARSWNLELRFERLADQASGLRSRGDDGRSLYLFLLRPSHIMPYPEPE